MDLRECPMCGETAYVAKAGRGHWRAGCLCGVGVNGGGSVREAIAAWNRRTPSPATVALVEAAGHARLALSGYVSRQSAIDKLDNALAAYEKDNPDAQS